MARVSDDAALARNAVRTAAGTWGTGPGHGNQVLSEDPATSYRRPAVSAPDFEAVGLPARTPEDSPFRLLLDGISTTAGGRLAGTVLGLKDNIDIAGATISNGTEGALVRTPPRSAMAWDRLRGAGAACAGITRMPEFATSVRTPACANPWNADRDCGGSSGGSAAAVAAGFVDAALGTDTGGSIRIPAALCGVAGLRPTLTSVPTAGVIPLSPTLDTVGPIAPSASECLRLHREIADEPGTAAYSGTPSVGYLKDQSAKYSNPEVLEALDVTASKLERAGVRVVPVVVPELSLAASVSFIIMLAEAAEIWRRRMPEFRTRLSPETVEWFDVGMSVSEADYGSALRLRRRIIMAVGSVMERNRLDALLLPTVGTTAARRSTGQIRIGGRDQPIAAAYSRFTALASVTGQPALTVPVGASSEGLPIGAQFIGPDHSEAQLCEIGGTVEAPAAFRAG